MRERKIITVLLIVMIFSSFPFVMGSSKTNEISEKAPELWTSKLDFELAEIVSNQSNENEVLDILVAIDFNQFQSINVIELVNGMNVTNIWPMLKGFSAKATPTQILELTRHSSVLRIEKNGMKKTCLDDARDYTDVDWWAQEEPSINGDADGTPTSYSKDDIVIAIVDTGIYTGHYDLDGGKVIGWQDICGDYQGEIQDDPYDDAGHGTAMASIAAGSGDGNDDYRGVAPDAALVGVKVLNWDNNGEDEDIITGFNWIAQNMYTYGIEIVSCSFHTFDSYGEYDLVAYFADLLIEQYGLVVLASAGRAGEWGSGTVESPGTAKYVITVGFAADPSEGFNDDWTRDGRSSEGPCDDGRIKPDILGPGVNIKCAKPGTSNQFEEVTGPSAACAFTAGLVALWLDKDYSLRYPVDDNDPNPRIKKLLMASATDVPGDNDPGLDNKFGAGRIDARDELEFYETDISASRTSAPLVLGLSQHEYNHYSEPLWIEDPNNGADWYKIKCYQGLLIHISAIGDPDLVLRIQLYNSNGGFITQSYAGRSRFLSYTATYQGRYYIKILSEEYSGDYYDIIITTYSS